jgi:DNA-binding MarR family transcriptional regulator
MADRYPDIPGAKGPDGTSQDAADAIAPSVPNLQRLAMRALARLGEATPIETTAATGLTREAIQPRLSELRRLGMVEPTGDRRQNPSGKWAAVLRLTDKGRAAL